MRTDRPTQAPTFQLDADTAALAALYIIQAIIEHAEVVR